MDVLAWNCIPPPLIILCPLIINSTYVRSRERLNCEWKFCWAFEQLYSAQFTTESLPTLKVKALNSSIFHVKILRLVRNLRQKAFLLKFDHCGLFGDHTAMTVSSGAYLPSAYASICHFAVPTWLSSACRQKSISGFDESIHSRTRDHISTLILDNF